MPGYERDRTDILRHGWPPLDAELKEEIHTGTHISAIEFMRALNLTVDDYHTLCKAAHELLRVQTTLVQGSQAYKRGNGTIITEADATNLQRWQVQVDKKEIAYELKQVAEGLYLQFECFRRTGTATQQVTPATALGSPVTLGIFDILKLLERFVSKRAQAMQNTPALRTKKDEHAYLENSSYNKGPNFPRTPIYSPAKRQKKSPRLNASNLIVKIADRTPWVLILNTLEPGRAKKGGKNSDLDPDDLSFDEMVRRIRIEDGAAFDGGHFYLDLGGGPGGRFTVRDDATYTMAFQVMQKKGWQEYQLHWSDEPEPDEDETRTMADLI